MVQIVERLLPVGEQHNRPGTRINPVGLVVHSTANPGVTAEQHYQYWASGYRASSAHVVVDWDSALALVPWQPGRAEMAWHAGAEANKRFLGLEVCEHQDRALSDRAIHNAVDVAAQLLRAYGWGPERALTHAQVSWWIGGTDHQDPLPYFTRVGWPWARFVAELSAVLGVPVTSAPAAPPETLVPVVDQAGRTLATGVLRDGRVLVPVRDLATALGADVAWDGSRAVVRPQSAPAVAPAPKPAEVPVPIVDPAGRVLATGVAQNGRTLVPLRELADALGLDVEWQPAGSAGRVVLRWPGK